MASYNVSKREAAKYGIERVATGGGSSKKSSSSDYGVDTSQLKALQNKYQEVLAPTAGETEAQTQLNNIITSKELGVAKAEQEPMAQQFVTGQSTALEKSAALKSLPLQTKLANLQAQRQAAADVLKSQLGFETENVNRQMTLAAQKRADDLAERSFKESVRQFNVSQAKKGGSGSASAKSTQLYQLATKLKQQGKNWGEIAYQLGNAGFNLTPGSSESAALDAIMTGQAPTQSGALQATASQLRNMGWSEDEIKAYLLTQ